MSKKTKLDRKELKKPDEFVSRGTAFMQFLGRKRKRFVPVFLAGVVLVTCVYAFDWWATKKLYEGWTAYDDALKLEGEKKWDAMRLVTREVSNIRPNYFALVALGDHFIEESKLALNPKPPELKKDDKGKVMKAEPAPPADKAKAVDFATRAAGWYTKALDFGELLPAERQLIYVNRGNAHELASDLDSALKDYQTASDFSGDPKGFALLNLARAQALTGKLEEAKSTYQKVTSDFVNSEYAKLAKNHLRRMNSPIFQAGNK